MTVRPHDTDNRPGEGSGEEASSSGRVERPIPRTGFRPDIGGLRAVAPRATGETAMNFTSSVCVYTVKGFWRFPR